ncbi:MAG: TetR/AcrR family transcriptional regulator [Nitriliruptorales bacterium]
MSSPIAQTAPARRAALSRSRVLEAALELVDREGLDALSMRRLAAELGVEAMSLYTHVANKDDLLRGLSELVWAEIVAAAPPEDDWPAWLRTLGHAMRDAVRRHPNALPVLVSGDVSPVPALELFADQLERADTAGLDRDAAVSALRAVTAFALGSAVSELCCFGPAPASRDETERQRLVRISRALPADMPDRLVDVALTVCGGSDVVRIFNDGLELIIRGCDLDG